MIYKRLTTGSGLDTIQQLLKIYPDGQFDNEKLYINNDELKIVFYWYSIFENIEIMIHHIEFKEDTKMDIVVGNESGNHIYFQFEYQGKSLPHTYSLDKKTQTAKIISAQSTGMPLNFEAKKGDMTEWMSIRIPKTFYDEKMTHMKDYIDKIFDESSPWVVFELSDFRTNELIQELFIDVKKTDTTIPIKNGAVIGKATECLGIFLDKIIKRDVTSLDRKVGLHQDDIKMMLEIKDELISLNDKTPSLQHFADKYGISISKLKRDFESSFGTTLPRFHMNYRLEMAYEMLATKNISVTEVSRCFGFKAVSNFTRNFKDKFKVNPKEVSFKNK